MFAPARSWTVALAVALSTSVGLGACDKQKAVEVQAPIADVPMRYDLTPGQVYNGHIEVRNQLETPLGPVTMRFEFDAELMVTGSQSSEGTLLAAKANNIQARLIVPDGFPKGAIPVNQATAEQFNGVEIRFRVNDRGEISDEPDLEGQSPSAQAILGQVMLGIVTTFVKLPEEIVKKGGTWDAAAEKDEDVVSSTGSGTFSKTVRLEGVDADLAQLEIENETVSKGKVAGLPVKRTASSNSVVFFAAQGGYVAKIDRTYSMSGGGQSLTGEANGTWTKGEKREVEIVSAGPSEVQEITDPCDPDYVGGGECADEQQAITDPCDGDYVGAEECKEDAAPSDGKPPGERPTEATPGKTLEAPK